MDLGLGWMQAFEARLRSLEGFLRDYQQRRRTRSLGSRSPSLYGDPTASGRSLMEQPGTSTPAHSGVQPNKRPRLEEAAKQEDQRCCVGFPILNFPISDHP